MDQRFQIFYNQFLKEKCEDRSKLVFVNPNFANEKYEPNGIHFPVRKLTEKILLGVLQWFMPEELAVLTNLWLEKNWGAEFKEVQEVLCTSKETALGYCLVSDRWNERDFFGNVLTEKNLRNIGRLYFRKRETKRPKRLVRKRGYKDKGSLRLPHQSIGYDYKKLKSVIQVLEEEDAQNRKVELLFDQIQFRLEKERAS